jgi:hypothetical protein
MGHIKPSSIPFDSSMVLVKKKYGTMRMCIEYRELNKKTIKNRYLIPKIDELIYELLGKVYFSNIDLDRGTIRFRLERRTSTRQPSSVTMGTVSFYSCPSG